MADYNWWLDQSSRSLHQRIDTTLPVSDLSFFQGDNPEINIFLKKEAQDSDGGFDPVDFPASGSLRIGLVNPDILPIGGTFTIGFGGDVSAALAADISAADLETELNGLASIDAAGGVTVTGSAGGPWKIKFTNVGSRSLLSINAELIEPLAEAQIHAEVEGDEDTQEVQYFRLSQSALAEQGIWTDIEASTVRVTEIQAGSAEGNELQEVEITPYPRSGTFTLTYGGEKTVPISYEADAVTVKSALEGLDSISAGDFSVTKQASGIWLIEFTGNLALGDRDLIIGSGAGLLSYEGKKGRLSIQRPAIQNYLDTYADENGIATCFLEIEIKDVNGNPTTYRFSCDLYNDGLPNPSSTGDAASNAYSTAEADLRFMINLYEITGLTGGGDTNLDGHGADFQVNTLVSINASVPTVAGDKWRLKTSGARPAAGSTIVHVVGDTDLYWQLAGS